MLRRSRDTYRHPVWSPDGTRIAFEFFDASQPSVYGTVALGIIASRGGTPTLFAKAFDESPSVIAWRRDGILFGALHRAWSHLYRLDPATGHVEDLTTPERTLVTDFSFAADGRTAAYLRLEGSWFAIVVGTVPGSARVVSPVVPEMAGVSFADRDVITWRAGDGTPIDGILIKPRNYVAGRRYPLTVVLHGGPAGADWPAVFVDNVFPVEQLSANGIVVLKVNYRGSIGYGAHFRALNVGNPGPAELGDVLAGVDSLVHAGIAQPDSVAIAGWSYGGFLAAFGAATTNRFTAAVVGAGVTDWVMDYSMTAFPELPLEYLGGTPWAARPAYERASPITYVSHTPTLILHCSTDPVVPVVNAYELYRQLTDEHVETRFATFDGCGHMIADPGPRRDATTQVLQWLMARLRPGATTTAGAG